MSATYYFRSVNVDAVLDWHPLHLLANLDCARTCSQEKLLRSQRDFRNHILEKIMHQWNQRTLRSAFGVWRWHARDVATDEKLAAVHVRLLLMFVNAQRVELLRQAFGLWRVEELSQKLNQVCCVW